MAVLMTLASSTIIARIFSKRDAALPKVKARIKPHKPNKAPSSEFTPPLESCSSLGKNLFRIALPAITISIHPANNSKQIIEGSIWKKKLCLILRFGEREWMDNEVL